MFKQPLLTTLTLVVFAVIACNPEKSSLSTLTELEKKMLAPNGTIQDKTAAEQYLTVAEKYAIELQQQKNTEAYVDIILKAAGLAKTIDKSAKALELYGRVADNMSGHAKAPTALFMKAFIYENDLRDLDNAKKHYELFLSRYPNDPDFADDAATALQFLGKSPDEVVKMFEAQQKAE